MATGVRSQLPRFPVPLLMLAVIAAWAASIAVGSVLRVHPFVHVSAVIAHVLSLVVAFGAVLLVDWVGFLWLVGRRQLHDTRRLERAASPLIWGGLAGLLVSGALLHPDITNPITQVKLGAVLILMLNGLFLVPVMRGLHGESHDTPFGEIRVTTRGRLLTALVISQACWWTAVGIGFVTTILTD